MPGTRKRPWAIAVDLRRARRAFVDLADDFLEEILERDDPGGAAVLVDDDRHLRPLAPHRRQHGVELRRLGHDRQRARVRPADHLVPFSSSRSRSLMWTMPTM